MPVAKSEDSIEFRLQCLESSLMEMQRQQEKDRQYIASLESRLKALGHNPNRPGPTQLSQKTLFPASKSAEGAVSSPVSPPKPPETTPRPKPKPVAAVKAPVRIQSSASPKSAAATNGTYAQAMERIRKGQPAQGRAMLQSLLAKDPQSPHKADALFAIGETYFKEGVFDSAILAYKDIAGDYPSHPKAPEAMLQIGRCYQLLADQDNARFYLQALVDEYPASAAVRQAKSLLEKLSGQANSVF